MKIRLKHVTTMPQHLEPGILYVSREFETAHHLCACGCGSKVRTPLSPAEWRVEETPQGPTLRPSIGNWQLPCRSHYLITRGDVQWSNRWSDAQIEAGRASDQRRLVAHLESAGRQREISWWRKVIRWIGL